MSDFSLMRSASNSERIGNCEHISFRSDVVSSHARHVSRSTWVHLLLDGGSTCRFPARLIRYLDQPPRVQNREFPGRCQFGSFAFILRSQHLMNPRIDS